MQQKKPNWPLERLQDNGFALLKGAVSDQAICELVDATDEIRKTDNLSAAVPGIRHLLQRCKTVRRFAKSPAIKGLAASIIGDAARPVKAILFDKTCDSNWFVSWHQDLTIAVKQKADVPGFAPWSIKEGVHHVQPTTTVLDGMITLRIHLDNCAENNGAINFIPGSHNAGKLSPAQITSLRSARESVICAANRGDIVLMRPLVLHSSSRSTNPDRRRVLQLEYAAETLPGGLKWAESSGLDSIELVMAIEEEFGIEIPDTHAEKIYTVGDMYSYLLSRLSVTPAEQCLSQRVFYKLRRALISNYNLERTAIKLETKMLDVLSLTEIENGWPYLNFFIDLKTPDFKSANEILGFKLSDRMLTMREMVSALIALNSTTLFEGDSSNDEVWRRLVDVIVRQLNVNRDDVKTETSFVRDLGLC